MESVALIGGGALAVQLAHLLRMSSVAVHGAYDDLLDVGAVIGEKVIVRGPIEEFFKHIPPDVSHALVAIGYHHFGLRKSVAEKAALAGIPLFTCIHRSAVVDPKARIGEGTVIMAGCIVDAHTTLGRNVLLNSGCVVAHNTEIRDHSMLGPGVVLSGGCSIGECSFLGTGTMYRDGIRSAAGVRTGVGAVVVADIRSAGTLVGNPAKPVVA